MEVNCQKYCFLYNNLETEKIEMIEDIFGIPLVHLDHGLKFLGFFLKHNAYKISNWIWLLQKIEKIIGHWSFRWISLGGRLVLIKFVLQNIPVYWCTLAKISSFIKTKIHRSFRIFFGEEQGNPWVFILLSGN